MDSPQAASDTPLSVEWMVQKWRLQWGFIKSHKFQGKSKQNWKWQVNTVSQESQPVVTPAQGPPKPVSQSPSVSCGRPTTPLHTEAQTMEWSHGTGPCLTPKSSFPSYLTWLHHTGWDAGCDKITGGTTLGVFLEFQQSIGLHISITSLLDRSQSVRHQGHFWLLWCARWLAHLGLSTSQL